MLCILGVQSEHSCGWGQVPGQGNWHGSLWIRLIRLNPFGSVWICSDPFENTSNTNYVAVLSFVPTIDFQQTSLSIFCQVRLYLPPDFTESKRYPLVINVYGGPNSQQVNTDKVKLHSFKIGFKRFIIMINYLKPIILILPNFEWVNCHGHVYFHNPQYWSSCCSFCGVIPVAQFTLPCHRLMIVSSWIGEHTSPQVSPLDQYQYLCSRYMYPRYFVAE